MAEGGGTKDTSMTEGRSDTSTNIPKVDGKQPATTTTTITMMPGDPSQSGEEKNKQGGVEDKRTDKEKEEELELIAKVRPLLEFYFGDSNLSRDRFLRKAMETDPEECMLPLLHSSYSSPSLYPPQASTLLSFLLSPSLFYSSSHTALH